MKETPPALVPVFPGARCVPAPPGFAVPLLFLLLTGCTAALQSLERLPEPVSHHEGQYLTVVCHFECGALGDEALAISEEAWELVASYLGVSPRPEAPEAATLHLYGEWREYQRVEDRIAGGRFRDTGAFSVRDDRSAHVMVPRDLGARLGTLSFHHRRNVAHEAAHLASYDRARGAYWPPWLAEGLAGWVERELVVEGVPGAIQENNPWASTQLWRIQRLLELGSLPGVPETLTGRPIELTLGDAYAYWIELFHFLVHGPWADDMEELVREVAAREIPEDRAWPEVGAMVQDAFGEEGLAEIDSQFRSYIRELQPGWVELFRSLERRVDEPGVWLQHAVGGLPVGAFAWRSGDPGRRQGFWVETRVEPLGDEPWEVRVALVRRDDDPLFVSLDSDGILQLLEFSYEAPDRVSVLQRERVTTPRVENRLVALRVRFRPGRVDVRVDGGPEVEFSLPDAAPTGLWGLGVAPETVALWRGWRVGAP